MNFKIFDYRKDLHNLFVTPQIRSRFLKINPGDIHDLHSHDLGHEIFFIIEGELLFYIDGSEQTVKSGQLCIAKSGEIHQVKNQTDQDVIMYLSVTPHIQPTHTGRDKNGKSHSVKFLPSKVYDTCTDEDTPISELIDNFTSAVDKLAKTSSVAAHRFDHLSTELKHSISRDDINNMDIVREQMWNEIREIHVDLYKLSDLWNDLAPRSGTV